MHKLQDAIEKARAARQALLATQIVRGADDVAAPAAGGGPGRWAAIRRREIDVAALAERRIVTPAETAEAAPFDVMRTKLIKTAREKGWRRVAITSPTPGCGKSTVSLNLAFSFARQPGLRTVLCELDLRKPSLAAMLDLGATHQFSRVLEGRAAFADHAARYGEGLLVATNAGPARNAAEMFHAPQMAAALAEIERDYAPDIMLFDLPPMMIGDDVLAFAPRADAILIVGAAEVSTIAQIDACERELAEHCEVAGVILNKCHHPGDEYGYGGGYEYGYGGGARADA